MSRDRKKEAAQKSVAGEGFDYHHTVGGSHLDIVSRALTQLL